MLCVTGALSEKSKRLWLSCCLKTRISKSCVDELAKQEAEGTFDLLTKKEAALRRKELKKLRQHLDGIKTMSGLPDVAIIIDQKC